MMPSHTGSSPIASKIGPTMGTTTKVISIKSRIKPSRKITTMTTSVAPTTPPGMRVNRSSINSSPPKPRKIRENIAEPIRIMNTMVVTSVVDWVTSRNLLIVNCRRPSASRVAPMAPTPAASVGVAAPLRIEPSTATINTTGGNRLRSNLAAERLDSPSTSATGASSGLSREMTIRYRI